MTTTTTQPETRTAPSHDAIYGAATAEPEEGCFYIPLAEFGQSLDNPDLDVWFEAFVARNKHFSGGFFEITAEGELKIMPPTGLPGYWQETGFAAILWMWADGYGGKAGGPTGRFRMPDGSRPGPDAIWISDERWNAATEEERRPPFAAIAPDFICEIVSPSNRGPELVRKVELFIANGTRLAWIINPERRLATIYRPGRDPETLVDPETLDGEDVLPGFVFEVRARIFDNVG
ncbi:MAG: Uma2 family endonuclease [Dehalococcoidia bacterium]|nr:Uma2 family endonuclease [Dehalococcoidia bacterium]